MFSEKLVHNCMECMVRWKNFDKLTEEEINLVKMAEAFRDAVSQVTSLGLRR